MSKEGDRMKGRRAMPEGCGRTEESRKGEGMGKRERKGGEVKE